ncbi:MAG: NAD-dependent epimerase/dehydratase family protein [Bacteroidota bacterium]
MKILLLGGKKFIGYHIALEAEKRGHSVTFFNRGKTYPELLPQFETIKGDRNTDIERLKGLNFDVVIDTCTYFPKQVKSACEVLGENIGKYILVSSVSVYNLSITDINEDTPVAGYDYESKEITNETYGPLKAAAEKTLVEQVGEDKSLIIRPGFIVGERDHSDRFTFWPVLMNETDKMIVPETGNLPIQFIDVKDLAEYVISTAERDYTGSYILTGPEKRYLFKDFILDCQRIVNPKCQIEFVSNEWLNKHDVVKSEDYPLCHDEEGTEGLFKVDCSKAVNAGLSFRALEETVQDTLKWFYEYKSNGSGLAVGMKPEEMRKLANR